MTRTRAAGAALAAIALLSACGSSGGSGGSGGVEADKSAQQILADAVNAMKSATSLHISARGTGGTTPETVTIELDVAAGGSAHGSLSTGGTTANVAMVNGKVYLQGRDFWSKVGGAQVAAAIGDHWAILPAGADSSGFNSFGDISTLADCFNLDHGTISKGGTATFEGRAAVVLLDKGDKPGTAPGKLYVAASGTPYPLGIQITGATRAGTPPGGEKCSGGSVSANDRATLTLSDYGKAVIVTPPPGALDLQSLAGGG